MGIAEWLFGVQPKEDIEERSGPVYSISDPALAEFLGLSNASLGEITGDRALSITAYWRALNVVAGTIAGLPLKTYRETDAGRERVKSFLDKPAGPYPLTAFAWKEMVMFHMLTRGETFLMHVYNQAGALIGLWPVHPMSVEPRWVSNRKVFKVNMADGSRKDFNDTEMTQVMGMTVDGLRGISPLTIFRKSFQLGLAGELAATRSLTNGLLIAGLVTPENDMTEDEAKEIKKGINARMSGAENAGDIAVINRNLKFTPWSMSNEDAQFIQSREFQVIEFCRMLGVPPHLVGATEKQTSWGTGVAEQNLGLARYTLMPWTSRLEEALSDLLPNPRFAEFDFAGLLQGTPKDEIGLLIEQVQAGILTKDEARAIRNLPPLTEAQKEEQKPQALPTQEDDPDANN